MNYRVCELIRVLPSVQLMSAESMILYGTDRLLLSAPVSFLLLYALLFSVHVPKKQTTDSIAQLN